MSLLRIESDEKDALNDVARVTGLTPEMVTKLTTLLGISPDRVKDALNDPEHPCFHAVVDATIGLVSPDPGAAVPEPPVVVASEINMSALRSAAKQMDMSVGTALVALLNESDPAHSWMFTYYHQVSHSHPASAAVPPCKDGNKCTREGCRFTHSEPECRFGPHCSYLGCPMRHP